MQTYAENVRFTYDEVMGQYGDLTFEEEQKLFRAYKNGDESAFERIVLSNIRLVYWVANQYVNKTQSNAMDDLVQVGLQGLIKAARKFDPERRTRFSTYAVYYVRLYITRFYRKDKAIKLPEHVYDDLGSLIGTGETKRKLARPNAQRRKMESLVNALGVLSSVSLDEQVREGEDLTYADIVADTAPSVEDTVSEADMYERVSNALLALNEKEREICLMFYVEGKTQSEIGKAFGFSKARVYQIIKVAAYKLRSLIERGYCSYADTESLVETMIIYSELQNMEIDEFMEFVYNKFGQIVTISVYRNAKARVCGK